MKKLLSILWIIITLGFAACTSKGHRNTFEDKWKPIENSVFAKGKSFLEIRKKGGQVCLMSSKRDTIISSLAYDRKLDCLTGNAGGVPMIIKYNKKSKHITIALKTWGFEPDSRIGKRGMS